MKDVEALTAEIETLKATNTELATKVEELTKALDDAVAKAEEEVAKGEEMIDFGGEMIAKSAIPAPVLKRLEEVAKAEELAELRKRADETIPNFKGTADERGRLMKAVGEDEEILAILRAADALFAGLTTELGKAADEESLEGADEKLKKMAAEYAKANSTTFEKGYAAVVKTKEGKALLTETYKN
jgi:cell division septum initiation protein DivIVA